MKYRDVSVKHATSPSHRDRSRQVVILRRSNSAHVRTKFVRSLRRIVQPFNLPVRSGLLPRCSPGCLFLPPTRQRCPALRNFDTALSVTHIAMGFDPTIAWKASPTRTPPPICTSAPFLKPRWSQDRGRREPFKEYTMGDFSQSGSSHMRGESSSLLQCCRCLSGKQVFESARGITCVINLAARAKNFHKRYKFASPRAAFRSAWSHYGDK